MNILLKLRKKSVIKINPLEKGTGDEKTHVNIYPYQKGFLAQNNYLSE